MRSAVLLACSAAFAFSVYADDRWVCSPAPNGGGWQCTGSGAAPAAPATPPASPKASVQTARPASVPPISPAGSPQSAPTTPSTSNAVAPSPSRAAALTLDWVPRAQLAADRLRALPEYCAGAYVEPSFVPMTQAQIEQLPMQVQAEQLQYWLKDRAELTGSVQVTRGNQSLIASNATYHEPQQTVTVDDGVTLREPGMLIIGETGEFNVDTGAASVTDSKFVLQPNELRGTASILNRNDAGDLHVTRGSFTRCEPGNQEWRVTSSAVQIDDGAKFGTARNAVLHVYDVPIFYTPYLRFPVTDERMSGWLFPTIGIGQNNGTDISAPYYLNLAPNYDATLTPRYISDRGTDLEGEFREISRFGKLDLTGAYLPNDNEYNGKYSKTDFDNLGLPGQFDPADRWLFAAHQQARFGDFTTAINSTKVSDFDYFRDLGSSLATSSQVQVQQYGAVSFARGGLSTSVWVQDIQRLDVDVTEPYRRLPEIDLNYGSQLIGPVSWSVNSSWASFDRPNNAFSGIARINGDRFDVAPRVRLPLDWTAGFIHFVGGYRYTAYSLTDVPLGTDDTPERKIWMGSVDSGLYFERESRTFGNAVQTLEPRLYYLNQQYRNQNNLPQFDVSKLSFTFDQLFRDNRFAGIDRIGDADQLTAAVTTRWLSGDTGFQRFRASIGQIFYFEDRRVTSTGVVTADDRHQTSAYAGQVAAAITSRMNLLTSATWDPNDGEWDEIGAALQYRADNRHIFNLGYRRRDDIQPVLRQADSSLYWSIFRQYSVIARFNYDLEEHRTIEALAGLEYSDCCWQLRVVGRKYLSTPGATIAPDAQADKGVFFQVVFKGLAGLGGRIDSMMQSGIRGYVAEEF